MTLPSIEASAGVQDMRLRLICRQHDLEDALDHILRPCFATGNEYHNQKHCTVVARWCHDLAMLAPLEGQLVTYYDMQLLLIAALFHDFAHDGVSDDAHQVETAVTNCELWMRTKRSETFTAHDRDTVAEIIRVTQYDGDLKFNREPQTHLQKIIRDADLLQVTEPDHIEVVLNGLRKEISRKLGVDLTMKQFYDGQVHFMMSMKLFTAAGEEIYTKSRPMIILSFFQIAHPEIYKEA